MNKKGSTMTKATWKELNAQGVKRCCAMFTNGTRCRRRASDAFEFEWCNRHGPVIKVHTDYANKAMAAQAKRDEDGDD